jgi:hypothetical protein
MKGRLGPLVRWLVLAIGLIAGAVAFALILLATDPAGHTASVPTASSPGGSGALWTGPLLTMGPGEIAMPEGADCGACHLLDDGGVGVRTIPVIAHPLHGYTECTACHSSASLVDTAPGHTGIHADQCVVCHTQSSVPVPTPRHPTLPDADCLGCHGTIAPLPSSMRDKPKELCWLCHHD